MVFVYGALLVGLFLSVIRIIQCFYFRIAKVTGTDRRKGGEGAVSYTHLDVYKRQMMIFNLCIGTITPPVGTTLFVGVKVGKTKIENVIKPLLLYFAAIFVVLMLVSYIPILSLWLPGLLGYV